MDNNGIDTIIRYSLNGIEDECERDLQVMKKSNQEITLNSIIEKLREKFERTFDSGLLGGSLDGKKRKEVWDFLPVIVARLSSYITVYEPEVITAKGLVNWLTPERRQDRYYWSLFKKYQEQSTSSLIVEKLDVESEKILSVLHDPKDEGEWDVRGLVLGSVQSGKTSNYSSLICKAADAGYKIIIVLAGIHNDLRQQTQSRLDEAFVGSHTQTLQTGKLENEWCGVGVLGDFNRDKAPKSATTLDDDFKGTPISAEELPWLFVVKKNVTVLAKLERWLAKHKDRPLLLIDDEADLASVNTSAKEEATATNRFIRKILSIFKRSSFVGYTATPFANIFIDSKADSEEYSKDLFPKDFIIRLSAPANYFGPEECFGTEDEESLDLFELFDPEDAKELTGNKGLVPATLRKAILQFLLSTAIRMKRVERRTRLTSANEDSVLESSMLVHVSHLIKDHLSLRNGIEEEVRCIQADLGGSIGNEETIQTLEYLLERQKNQITPEVRSRRESIDTVCEWFVPDSLEEIFDDVIAVADNLEVKIVNGESKKAKGDELNPKNAFIEKKIKPTIFIGGNKLSRGLTLPGLCVSVFLRGTSMYDTLMQMGRWFGYRDGYLDLCRLYAPLVVIDRYRRVSEALNDFTVQIDEMNSHGVTPKDFGLKVLSHPGLMVTARNKMLTATAFNVGFNGQISDKRVFSLDFYAVQNNWQTAKKLISDICRFGKIVYSSAAGMNALQNPYPFEEEKRPKGRLWTHVPTACIIEFLDKYHANRMLVPKDADREQAALVQYLKKLDEKEILNYWTVWVPGDPANPKSGPEQEFGSCFVDRTGSERGSKDDASDTELGLRILKSGSSEYIGVPKDLYEAAVAQNPSRNKLFRTVRKLSGDPQYGVDKEGFFQLYAFTTDRIKENEALRSSQGQLPLISYYLWMPENANASEVTVALGNSTVGSGEDDE